MRRILVCGSRSYEDAALIRKVLRAEAGKGPFELIYGAAPGADTLAARAALSLGMPVKQYPADWKTHGKAAGPIRNRQMLDAQPVKVFAFGAGRGTQDTVSEAEKRGIPVVRYA